MTVYAELHAHSRLSFSGGAGGPKSSSPKKRKPQ